MATQNNMSIFRYPLDIFDSFDSASSSYPGYMTFRPKPFKNSSSSTANTVVQILMPKQVASSYEHEWSSVNLNSVTSEILKGFMGGSGFVDAVVKAGGAVVEGGKDALLGEGGTATIDLSRGAARNNKVALTYKGENIRNFDFSFDFAPRDSKEAIEVLNIINTFKKHSFTKTDLSINPNLKSQTDSTSTISFPDLWQIHFNAFETGGANRFVPFKIGTSACTKVDVNYTPDDTWSVFDNGIPSHLTLNVSFQELHPVSNSSTNNSFPTLITDNNLADAGF